MTSNTGNGANYLFQLKLYRDDVNSNAAAVMPATSTVGVYDAVTHAQITTIVLNKINQSFINLGDPCYTPDPNVVKIEQGIYINSVDEFLANNSNGYYIQYENYARNGIIDNMANPATSGITIFAMFPDPALGQNSSPDFGAYPLDAYFCVNDTKLMVFPVVDPDGDSLVYSLVDPMNGTITGGGTSAGSGAYPFYPSCQWDNANGYSLLNILGGNPPMSIDPVSGVISATPGTIGFFIYTVRVEEYRNGVKIGEVRRDVQYASLACTIATPPIIAINGTSGDFPDYFIDLDVSANDTSCFDIDASVEDPTDSVYLQLTSSNFDLINNYQYPNSLGNNSFSYINWEDNIGSSVVFNGNAINNGYYGNLSNVYLRYCWVPLCDIIDSVFNIAFDIYAIDVDNSACAGSTTNQASLEIVISQSPNDTLLVHNILDSFCVDYTLNGQTYNSPGIYNQVLTNSLGCDSTIVLDLQQSTINLNVISTDEYCSSANGIIEVNPSGANSPYVISFDGLNSPDNLFDSLSTGSYNISVTSSDGCVGSQLVDINDLPFKVDTVLISDINCSGNCDGAIDIVAPSAYYYTIQGNQNAFDSTSTFDSLCVGNLMIYAENLSGCVDSMNITINSPQPIISSLINDTTVCVGGTVTSTIQFSGGSGDITYNWSNGLIGDTINWVVINDTSVYVYGVDTNGCYSDTVYQNIQTYLPLSLSMSSDVIICENDSTLITATVSGGIGSGYSYSWSGGLSDTTNHYVAPNGSVSYYVTVNDACGTPPLTDSIAITVQPLPIVDFTSNLIEGCIPLTVSFSEVFSSAGICSWDFGNSNSSSQCGTVSNTYNSVGCWDVSLSYSDSLNCSSSKTYSNLICSYDNPVADFDFSPQEISLLNSSVNFSSNSSSNSSQFLWELESPTSTNVFYDEDFSFSYSDYDLGDYSICLSVETDNGCIDSICKSITIKDDFIFYIPNSFTPDADGRNDDFGPIINGANKNYDFSVFNRWGEMLFSKDNNNLRWDGKHFKTGNILPKGVYVWKVEVFDEINQENKEFIGNVTLLR